MKKTVSFILLIMYLIACCISCGTYGMTQFYINGETSPSSYIQMVRFYDDHITLPLENVLKLLGAKYTDSSNDFCLNETYFIIDYKNRCMFLEDAEGYLEYLQKDQSAQSVRWNTATSILPSENSKDGDVPYVLWGTAVVTVDQNTLIGILHEAGIELEINVAYKGDKRIVNMDVKT